MSRKNNVYRRMGIVFIVAGGGLLALSAYLGFVYSFGFGFPCSFSLITGLDCPGCGMTGAVFRILRMDFSLAFRRNALSVTVVPAGFFYGIYRAVLWVKSGEVIPLRRWEKNFLIMLATLIFVYSVLRNIV